MLLQPKESFKLKNSSIEKKRIIIDLLYSKDALQFLMNFAATKRLPGFIHPLEGGRNSSNHLHEVEGNDSIRLIVSDNCTDRFHAGDSHGNCGQSWPPPWRGGTDPACLDPREWLAALSLGGPWGAEGCCQLGWTAQDLPPHGHPHPRARSPQAARRISGATPASSSSFRFQTTWCPLWEKSPLSGLVPRGRRRRERGARALTERRGRRILPRRWIFERSLLLARLDRD